MRSPHQAEPAPMRMLVFKVPPCRLEQQAVEIVTSRAPAGLRGSRAGRSSGQRNAEQGPLWGCDRVAGHRRVIAGLCASPRSDPQTSLGPLFRATTRRRLAGGCDPAAGREASLRAWLCASPRSDPQPRLGPLLHAATRRPVRIRVSPTAKLHEAFAVNVGCCWGSPSKRRWSGEIYGLGPRSHIRAQRATLSCSNSNASAVRPVG
jgi:hypothetical protein